MSNDRPNLSGAFAPVSPRGAKLEGLLAPKRRKTDEIQPDASAAPARQPISVVPDLPEATTPVVTDVEGLGTSSAKSQKKNDQPQRKQGNDSKSKASDSVPGALRNVGVYLAPDLLLTVKEAIHAERTTYADLLLDAFEAISAETIAREFRAESIPSTSGMPRRAPRRRGEAGIQIQVRLDGHQVSWLDEKVSEFNAPSRSALVSAVYRLYLAK